MLSQSRLNSSSLKMAHDHLKPSLYSTEAPRHCDISFDSAPFFEPYISDASPSSVRLGTVGYYTNWRNGCDSSTESPVSLPMTLLRPCNQLAEHAFVVSNHSTAQGLLSKDTRGSVPKRASLRGRYASWLIFRRIVNGDLVSQRWARE